VYSHSIDTYNSELFNDENGIEHKINSLKEEIEEYHTELLDGDDENDSIKEKISNTYKELALCQIPWVIKFEFSTSKINHINKISSICISPCSFFCKLDFRI